MARAIVRVSIDGPPGSAGHAETRKAKRSLGPPFSENTRTGVVEADAGSVTAIIAALGRLLTHLDNLPSGFGVDHVWIYFDKKGD